MIEVVATGPLTTVQDLGRPSYASLGVPRSGAFDGAAARLANRLVGNDDSVAVLEVTLGGLAIRAIDAVTVALTGADCPGLDHGSPRTLAAGQVLRLGTPAAGLRSYLAVRGGIAVDPTLGSRSSDLLSGLGPGRLQIGDLLKVGSRPAGAVSAASSPSARRGDVLQLLPGPRMDWFVDGASALLTTATWTVRSDSDRVGVRLDGPPLSRAVVTELPSEPTRPGAVQVPADGKPIIFGPDAPVTGGYPVIAILADVDPAAQLRPGDEVRFAFQ